MLRDRKGHEWVIDHVDPPMTGWELEQFVHPFLTRWQCTGCKQWTFTNDNVPNDVPKLPMICHSRPSFLQRIKKRFGF